MVVDIERLIVVALRHDVDAAVAQRVVQRGELGIAYIDILKGDLDFILGDRAVLLTLIKELLEIGVELDIGALRLFRHRFSLHST